MVIRDKIERLQWLIESLETSKRELLDKYNKGLVEYEEIAKEIARIDAIIFELDWQLYNLLNNKGECC